MIRQLLLGAAVGAFAGLMSWLGNQVPHLVSTFPDLITFLVLVALVTTVVWVELSRRVVPSRSAAMRTGAVVGSAAGAVFGAALIWIGVLRFTRPFAILLSYGFLTAFIVSVMCGVLAAFAWSLTQRRPA
jgi:hypothetical protein